MAEKINSSLKQDWVTETAVWRNKVAAWLGPEAVLIHVSFHTSDIRIYRMGDRVLKVRRFTPATVVNRPNALEDEYRILRQLHACGLPLVSFPKAEQYIYEPEWEALEMTAIDPPVIFDPVLVHERESWKGIGKLVRSIWALNLLGISHGDLTYSNAALNKLSTMSLLDFDQAVLAHPLRCLLRDFIGVPCLGKPAQYSVWDRISALKPFSPFSVLSAGLRRGFQWVWKRRTEVETNPVISRAEVRGDLGVQQLAQLWHDAAVAGANSPGSRVAYYSLDVRGFHFPGERPWVLRWEMLSRRILFGGKDIVELGCNFGLLALHAGLAGASKVVAADHNQRVLDAAGQMAELLGVQIDFHKVDFDRDPNWEKMLGPGDLVCALSLTYWLTDKERLWTYLGGFREVIFEGHEPAEEIDARFSNMGYSLVRLGISERARVIFHATRDSK